MSDMMYQRFAGCSWWGAFRQNTSYSLFDNKEPIHVVQIDAHLNFVEERHGICCGDGNSICCTKGKEGLVGLGRPSIRDAASSVKEGPRHTQPLRFPLRQSACIPAGQRKPDVTTGIDLVEISRSGYDRAEAMAILAAQVLMKLIDRTLDNKSARL